MIQALRQTQPGTLDPMFAEDGVLDWQIPGIASRAPQAVLSLADGKLIAVSRLSGFQSGFAVVRLTDKGALDTGTGFGDGRGFVQISFADTHIEIIFGAALLMDDGVLITCQYSNQSEASSGRALVRLLKDGRLDQGFGRGGAVFFNPLEGATPEQARKMRSRRAEQKSAENARAHRKLNGRSHACAGEQPDGKIVLITSAVDFSFGDFKGQLVRLNPDGSLDKTFNGTGSAFVELADVSESYGRGLALQPDGKLVVFGDYREQGANGWYVTRFNAQGQQDAQFATLKMPDPQFALTVFDISVRAKDGLIALVGGVFEDFHTGVGMISLLNRDGTFNRAFNQGRPLYSKLTDMGQQWSRCAFGGDDGDRLIVAGTGGSEFLTAHTVSFTARYLLTGALDTTFANVGWAVFDDRNWLDVTRDMALTSDGRIVVCGEHYTGQEINPQAGWMLRYLT
jgi:uncharacterized delta-60 repeat protein